MYEIDLTPFFSVGLKLVASARRLNLSRANVENLVRRLLPE